MAQYRDEGIVLRTVRLGEADRIITLVTPGNGKIRAVAKGVRKTKSRIGARLEPLSKVHALFWRGRELDVVTQVEVTEAFAHVRGDLARLATAMTMLEVVDHAAVERQGAPQLFGVLAGALAALERDPSPVLLGAFCLRVCQIEGVGPVTGSCARCGAAPPLVAFSPAEGGFLCPACRRGQAVAPAIAELADRICRGGLARVLSEGHKDEAPALEHLALSAVEHHLDRRLRSRRSGLEEARPGT